MPDEVLAARSRAVRLREVFHVAVPEDFRPSEDEPFIGLALKLEMPVVRELLAREEIHTPEPVPGRLQWVRLRPPLNF